MFQLTMSECLQLTLVNPRRLAGISGEYAKQHQELQTKDILEFLV